VPVRLYTTRILIVSKSISVMLTFYWNFNRNAQIILKFDKDFKARKDCSYLQYSTVHLVLCLSQVNQT